MNQRQIRDRLARLEATLPGHDDADDVESWEVLAMVVDDDRAGQLYNAYLTSVSLPVCPHQEIGACVSCWTQNQRSEKVRTALHTFREHLEVLRSQHTTKGDPS